MLKWMTAKEARDQGTYGKLYLAYQLGYPLMVADWKTGYGFRNVRTSESIDPILVAEINLPKVNYNE